MKKNNKAITLVEITIGILISALIFVALMNVLSAGVKGSTKGLAVQDNMQVASILMAQIEYDLLRAVKIEFPEYNVSSTEAKWDFCYKKSGATNSFLSSVDYSLEDGAVARKISINNKIEKTFFGKGHKIQIHFIPLATDIKTKKYENTKFLKYAHAMWVELKVASKDDKNLGNKGELGENEVTLKRLVFLRNI